MGVSRVHNLALGVTNNIGLCPKLPGKLTPRLGNIDMIIVKNLTCRMVTSARS